MLELLINHDFTGDIGIKKQNEAIIIETEFNNFDKVVKIYERTEEFTSYLKLHPLLDDDNYQKFVQELQYYGVYSLFTQTEFDPEQIISNLKNDLSRHIVDVKGFFTETKGLRRKYIWVVCFKISTWYKLVRL